MSLEMFKLVFTGLLFVGCAVFAYLAKVDISGIIAVAAFALAARTTAENIYISLLIQQNEDKIRELTKKLEEHDESNRKP